MIKELKCFRWGNRVKNERKGELKKEIQETHLAKSSIPLQFFGTHFLKIKTPLSSTDVRNHSKEKHTLWRLWKRDWHQNTRHWNQSSWCCGPFPCQAKPYQRRLCKSSEWYLSPEQILCFHPSLTDLCFTWMPSLFVHSREQSSSHYSEIEDRILQFQLCGRKLY